MALDPKNCKNGEEQYEFFDLPVFNRLRKPSKMLQYDYRDHDGRLFSCVVGNLEAARIRRDAWLESRLNP